MAAKLTIIIKRTIKLARSLPLLLAVSISHCSRSFCDPLHIREKTLQPRDPPTGLSDQSAPYSSIFCVRSAIILPRYFTPLCILPSTLLVNLAAHLWHTG